jgi:hypothetical protein
MSTVVRVDNGLYLLDTEDNKLYELVSDNKYGDISFFKTVLLGYQGDDMACVVEFDEGNLLIIIIRSTGRLKPKSLKYHMIKDDNTISGRTRDVVYPLDKGIFFIYKTKKVFTVEINGNESTINKYFVDEYFNLDGLELRYFHEMNREDMETTTFAKNDVLYSVRGFDIEELDVIGKVDRYTNDISISTNTSLETLRQDGTLTLPTDGKEIKNVEKYSRQYFSG